MRQFKKLLRLATRGALSWTQTKDEHVVAPGNEMGKAYSYTSYISDLGDSKKRVLTQWTSASTLMLQLRHFWTRVGQSVPGIPRGLSLLTPLTWRSGRCLPSGGKNAPQLVGHSWCSCQDCRCHPASSSNWRNGWTAKLTWFMGMIPARYR